MVIWWCLSNTSPAPPKDDEVTFVSVKLFNLFSSTKNLLHSTRSFLCSLVVLFTIYIYYAAYDQHIYPSHRDNDGALQKSPTSILQTYLPLNEANCSFLFFFNLFYLTNLLLYLLSRRCSKFQTLLSPPTHSVIIQRCRR